MSVLRVIGYVIVLLLALGVIAGALAIVYTRQESRRLFTEYNELTKKRDQLKFEFTRLELERATKAEINGVEKVARGELGMVSPSPANTVVIRR